MAKQPNKQETLQVTVNTELTAVNMKQLKQELIQAFNKSDSISLDLSASEACDTAGIQLLIAGQKEAKIKGKSFTVNTWSEAVVVALKQVGLDQTFLD